MAVEKEQVFARNRKGRLCPPTGIGPLTDQGNGIYRYTRVSYTYHAGDSAALPERGQSIVGSMERLLPMINADYDSYLAVSGQVNREREARTKLRTVRTVGSWLGLSDRFGDLARRARADGFLPESVIDSGTMHEYGADQDVRSSVGGADWSFRVTAPDGRSKSYLV